MMVPTKFSVNTRAAHFSVAKAMKHTNTQPTPKIGGTLHGSKPTSPMKTKARSAGASKGILMVPSKSSMSSIKAHFSLAMKTTVKATVEDIFSQILIMKILVKSAGF